MVGGWWLPKGGTAEGKKQKAARPLENGITPCTHNLLPFPRRKMARRRVVHSWLALSSGPIVEAKHVDRAQDCPDRYVSRMVSSWWFGWKDGRSGGTAFWPPPAKDRLFLSLHYQRTTDPPTVGGCGWLVGWLEWRRPSDWLTQGGKVWATTHIILLLCRMRWAEATRLVLVFWWLELYRSHPPLLLPYFHIIITGGRRAFGSTAVANGAGKVTQVIGAVVDVQVSFSEDISLVLCLSSFGICETEHGKATQCHGHSRRACTCSRQCSQALEGTNCHRDTLSLMVYGRSIGVE